MALTTTKSAELRIAFLLDGESLRTVAAALQGICTELQYTVALSDGSTLKTASLDDILGCANSTKRTITSISVETPWGKALQAHVEFGGHRYAAPVQYRVTGNDKEVLYFSDKLEERLSSMRLWYSALALIDFGGIQFAAGGLLFIGVVMLAGLKVLGSEIPGAFALTAEILRKGVRAYFYMFGVLYLALLICGYVQKKVLPISTFAIGEGKKRHESVVFLRRAFGVGFGLSLLGSLVAAVVWAILRGVFTH